MRYVRLEIGLNIASIGPMYYFGVFKFMYSMRRSANRVLNSLVNVYVGGNAICQQLAIFDIDFNMPLHIIRRLVIQYFNNLAMK